MKKTIKFLSLSLSYFKGIKSLDIQFSDTVTNIYGSNGSGKTTICDAVQWVLFGKTADGDTKFGIKTRDENGNVIPDVEHSVTLSLSIDGVRRDIKRQWVEERTMRRGEVSSEVKHHAEYFVDGMVYTKRDFDKFISDIVNESTFRAITNPEYFLSLKWQDQRAFLEHMADVDYSSIDSDSRFDAITHQSAFKTFDEYLQHLSYNIRKVKDSIDTIPTRIEEQTRTCPELLDWDDIQHHADVLAEKFIEKQSLINSLKSSPESASRKVIREQIEFQQSRIDNMQTSARNLSSEELRSHSEIINRQHHQLEDHMRTLDGLQAKLRSNATLAKQIEQTIRDLNNERTQSSGEWKKVSSSVFTPPTESVCPLCHRPFEGTDFDAEVAKLREAFNADKAQRLSNLKERAVRIKEDLASAEAQLKTLLAEQPEIDKQIADIEAKITENKHATETLPSPRTADQILADNPNYQQALDKISSLQSQLEGDVQTDNTETIRNIEAEITELEAKRADHIQQLATKNLYLAHQQRIEELREELKTLTVQLDNLEQQKATALLYQESRDNLLESTVNTKFALVNFRLFDTLNDGTRKAYCEAWVGGVPYSDLNSAAKLNAGRDIINVISDYYQIVAPVLTDNAESVNHFLTIDGQDIRLYVSNDEEITIR